MNADLQEIIDRLQGALTRAQASVLINDTHAFVDAFAILSYHAEIVLDDLRALPAESIK
jgi:hypothetical protein